MTDASRPLYKTALDRGVYLQQLQKWQAAQLVRSQVAADDGQQAMLDCLGLADAYRPQAFLALPS